MRVPAKVNLELRVGPPRADGFHSLATIYQAVSLFDTVSVTPAEDWQITLSGRTTEGVPADAGNLAVRAAAALAAELGSDIPFLLHGGTALGSGRGEQVVPVLAKGTYHWVFALADGGLSTPAVYAECDRLRAGTHVPEPRPSVGLLGALRSGDVLDVAECLGNDLEPAAISLAPKLGDVIEEGLSYGALAALVSS